MKLKKLAFTLTVLISIFCLVFSAYAASWEDFTDVSGHWAEATVKKGFEDGLITGVDDTCVAPNAPITAAQMITVLCRVLGATEKADASSLGISSDVWYYDAAGKAMKLGLISSASGKLDSPLTRQNALAMMAKAFCLIPAEPDYSVLTPFSDASEITDENRGAIAALCSKNLIQGFDGALNLNSNITRAEFLTILYRVASNYISAGALTSGVSGGSVLKGDGSLSYISAGNLWFDCSSQSVSLIGVKADTVTLRNNELTSLYLSGGSDISSLVVAVQKGSASLGGDLGAKINVLRLESCTDMSVGSCVDKVEITGNNMSVSISGKHESLVITGNGNTITLSSGTLASLKITGENNVFTQLEDNEITQAEISGQNNRMTVNGTADTITLSGYKSILDGTGNAAYLNINVSGCTISLAAECITDNSNQAEIDRVLKLVTLGYSGNYTLKWAQEHDYTEAEKETFVNAKEYSSSTEYLIWVNLSMQRVNIFKGSTGAWDLIYSCIAGTGAPGRGTPIGVWKTTYKAWGGWTTSTYTVKPVVGFKDNTGYAFHSRLYYPGTSKLSDSSIGYPVSHGCVRMYDADILYIYNNITLGTTVVVY